ncbi:MAG: hypothetical protein L0J14_00150 [Bifidobacterium crudilactis]|nr:hypothetical protein [Bifidobacterium crudilactis]MDN6522244.1 hypothetical protein [Bifidobacterium crudilactis]
MMMPDSQLDWPGLYQSVGSLVEQNETLFHKTDDHESRVRVIEGESMRQNTEVKNLSQKVDVLDAKVDGLSSGVKDLGSEVSGLHRSINNLEVPHVKRLKVWRWVCRHMNPLTGALLGAVGSGVGGYLIALLLHA